MEIVEAREGGSEARTRWLVAMGSGGSREPGFILLTATRLTKHSKYEYIMVVSGLPFGVKYNWEYWHRKIR